MKNLIYVSNGMEDGDLAAYVEQMAKELDTGFERHDLDSVLESPLVLTRPGQWLFFSWPLAQESRQILSDMRLGYYLLYDGAEGYDQELIDHLDSDSNLLAPIDFTRDHRFHIPLLRSDLVSVGADDEKKKLLGVGENLNKMIEFSQAELQRVKKLHELVVPMKNDNFKGIKILSKFAAGEGSGGEFFDIVRGENELLLLLTNTKSYVASSVILSHFEKLRGFGHFDQEKVQSFLRNLSAELKDLELIDFNNSDFLQLLVVKIDLGRMNFEGYQFGKSEFISSKGHTIATNSFPVDKEFFEQAHFSFDLERGERLVVSSPGVRENCGGLLDDKKFEDFIRERLPLGPRELLNEIYFQLKKKRDSDFLKYDASVIYIEVDKNVIVEV